MAGSGSTSWDGIETDGEPESVGLTNQSPQSAFGIQPDEVVSHQVRQVGCEVEIGKPKSEASNRVIALDHATIAMLRRYRDRSGVSSAGGEPVGFLFSGGWGEPLRPDSVTHLFRQLNEESGLPPIRLHDLRHGAASLSLAAGNDLKTVQAMLGHASIVLTADTYTSVLPSLARQSAEATARLVLDAARVTGARLRRRRRSRQAVSRRPMAAGRVRVPQALAA